MDMIGKANMWAAGVWKRVVKSWEIRKQDYNYRRFLARPGIQEALKMLTPVKDGVFLDLGCGDGSEMRHVRRTLAEQGCGGTFFGFDLQQSLIEIARIKNRRCAPIEMVFDSGELEDLVESHSLIGKADRVFSTFLLQELSDAEKYFKMSSDCLNEGGWGVFLFLHPAFGKAILEKGCVHVNKNLKSKSWRWAGEYPIVEEDGKTFYVPYFHRELDDYLQLARKYFSAVEFLERKPTEKVIRKCERENRSPFYDHPGNVYYPEIVNVHSSLIFMVRK